MNPNDRTELAALMNTVIGFAATHFPGAKPKAVIVQFDGDMPPFKLPIASLPALPPVPAVALSDQEEDVLAALEEADRPMIGKELAARAGHRYDGNFRGLVARLVKTGQVRKVDGGYAPAEGGDA